LNSEDGWLEPEKEVAKSQPDYCGANEAKVKGHHDQHQGVTGHQFEEVHDC